MAYGGGVIFDMRVLHFANTFIGKPGNIGVRTSKILRHLSRNNIQSICVCRGTIMDIERTDFIDMGILGHVPRIMNAARTYVWNGFNHRPYDIWLYEKFSSLHVD
jgi:hypothetical protein